MVGLVNVAHEKMKILYNHRYQYFGDNDDLEKREELAESINKVDVKIIEFLRYLDANEKIIKQFYNDYLKIHESFISFDHVLSRFDLDYSDRLSDEKYLELLKSDKKKASIATYKLLNNLLSFKEIILNEFYKNIF